MHTSIQGTLPLGQQSRYTKMPDDVLSVLTPRDHQVLHLLLSYRWFSDSTIRPYVGTMAERLGVCKRTVQRSLRRLELGGYLVTVARYRDESEDGEHHGQTSNLYAPGPLLLPLLPPLDTRDDGPPEQARRTPMTPTTYKKETKRNYTPRMGRDYDKEDYFATRDGRLPQRCADCNTVEHSTAHHRRL